MIKISEAFKNKKAFIAFITAGDPDIETTEKLILGMEKNGVDLIEIGIPFSDPVAEGRVIQEADIRALANGATTDKIFDMVERLRPSVKISLVFMTYCNVIFGYGTEKFMKRCNDVGVCGVIVPDVPYEEKEELLPYAHEYGIEVVSLVAPTSKERVKMIAQQAEGFIYIVSSRGVTGVREKIDTDIKKISDDIRAVTDVPCAVGFGISNPEQAKAMSENADGIIIGSYIVSLVEKYGKDSPAYVEKYVKEISSALKG